MKGPNAMSKSKRTQQRYRKVNQNLQISHPSPIWDSQPRPRLGLEKYQLHRTVDTVVELAMTAIERVLANN